VTTYVVAGSRPWNRRTFEDRIRPLPGDWRFVTTPEELEVAVSGDGEVRAVFFLHWSHKVPEELLDQVVCVNFHMTDVPFGRGGSPLQNLVASGHQHTMLTALQMTAGFDAGPVFAKRELCLRGTAEEVYIRAGDLSAEMIAAFVDEWPEAVPQAGDVTVFRRRTPADSRIPEAPDLDRLHDFIRMLDADGYPAAFLEYGGLRFEFRRSARYDGRLEADVRVTRADATQ
jgi:methionyl-tRNA formyltransferase